MARAKKTSKIIEESKDRLARIKSIDQHLDLGNGITAVLFEELLRKAEKALDEYNMSLTLSDKRRAELHRAESGLRDMHGRVLLGVGATFGKNSLEYEKAGGTRKGDKNHVNSDS